ncbi:homogentisate 1,2-dioxygenase [Francisellaceae bacterium CB300]
MSLKYMSGFQSYFQTEAKEGVLPKDRNAPQKVNFGLYAEQFNNSAFTAPRHANFNSWQYKLRPSIASSGKSDLIKDHFVRDINNPDNVLTPPDQIRWSPLDTPEKPTDLIDGLMTFMYNSVISIHLYSANKSMDRYFYCADGEWLFVLQQGRLRFKTEMGIIEAAPSEIVVIPRGIRYQVELLDEDAKGYICESQASHFFLPERGPIGANGLAEERHFLAPVAYFEDLTGDFEMVTKFQGQMWKAPIKHSPLDVVAWHGNLYPYKYDLSLFCPMNSVLKDHADPSIFTVLSAPSAAAGTANVDFVIFPERWVVGEDTFRPPYYHRNIMSEFMGLIHGQYDAKGDKFAPGGGSLHNTMSSHGPDKQTFDKASNEEMKPVRYKDTLAFMFESRESYRVTKLALEHTSLQKEYIKCWDGLSSNFKD